ncbi:MAG TPA: DUF3606 domain-containing protein [Novosphingobium sp.]|nr:DUF3606 domain-containing protein [Novosphingobium sp.]
MATIPQEHDGLQDLLDVSTDCEHDVYYWCSRFRVSQGLLKELIASAGTRVADIERMLRLRDG